MIESLRNLPQGGKRLILAYVDIGEAEDYRTYWQPDWVPPRNGRKGTPDYILAPDPDGWTGNYVVAYWDQRWKQLWTGSGGLIERLAEDGFDGVYLDWVEAYDDDRVIQEANRTGKDPAVEMLNFIQEIRDAGQGKVLDFLIVAQNAPYLLDADPGKYVELVDGLAVEDTWFGGEGDAEWNDAAGGDIPNQYGDEWGTMGRLEQYRKFRAAGVPVFSVDYSLNTANVAQVYQQACEAGLRPLVTRVSLERLTDTPPPACDPLEHRNVVDGIYKADDESMNAFVQTYHAGSAVILMTPDLTRWFAFLDDDWTDGVLGVQDLAGAGHTLTMGFSKKDEAEATLAYAAGGTDSWTLVRRFFSPDTVGIMDGIYKPADETASWFIQTYAQGSAVLVFSPDLSSWYAFLDSDWTDGIELEHDLAGTPYPFDLTFLSGVKADATLDVPGGTSWSWTLFRNYAAPAGFR